MAITSAQQQDLIKVGVGMFNASLGGYIGPLAAAIDPAGTTKLTIAQLYDALAGSDAFKALNFATSAAATNAQFATWYANTLLGTSVSATAVTAAATALQSLLDGGQSRGAVMKVAVDYLTSAAGLADTTYGPAAQMFANKVTVSTDYTITKSGSSTSLVTLQSTIASVDATAASVTAATSGATQATPGQTYNLTTAVDNIAAGSSNDTVNGYIDAAGTTDTFTTADNIDAGGGTDTFNITVDGNGAGSLPAANVVGMEVWKIREVGGTNGTYDFGTVAGETSVINNRSTDQVTFNNVGAGATVGVSGDGSTTNGATIFTMDSATGAVTLNIDGGTTAGNITRNATGAATITVNSTGAANTIGVLDVDTATAVKGLTIKAATNLTGSLAADYAASSTLTVSGAATTVNLSGAALSPNFTKVDASGLTAGGVRVKVDQTDATVDTQFIGGAGADTLDVGKVVYNSATLNADAGAGTDVLKMSDQAALTSTTAKYLLNFETLSLYDDNDAALDTFDSSLLSGLTSLTIAADSTGDGYAVTNISSSLATAITISGTQNVAPTLTVKNATTVGQLDTLSVTVSDGSSTVNTITIADITSAGVETVNLTATDNIVLSAMTGLTALTKLATSGAGTVSLTTGALALNVNTVIDASAGTGATTLVATAATTNPFAYTGNAAVDTITDSAIGGGSISTGAGKDVITLTAKTGGTAGMTLTPGAGADTITVTAAKGNDAQDKITVKYADGDSVIDTSATGNATTGYSTTNTDNITGVDFANAAAAAAGHVITLDTPQSATAVTFSTTAATFGTTTVTNAYDFYVYDDTAGNLYVYQDTNGDKTISNGEFSVKLVGAAAANNSVAGEFTIVSGNLQVSTL